MKKTTKAKPTKNDIMPLSILSCPKLGPTVRSSTISTGAANAPALSKSDKLRASCGLSRPVVWNRLLKTP